MIDGLISIDSESAKEVGFTSDKFSEDSYLWKEEDKIYISLITSKHEGKGNLSKLFKDIEDKGFYVLVPTPFARMEAILRKKGFVMHVENTEIGDCEVWQKP